MSEHSNGSGPPLPRHYRWVPIPEYPTLEESVFVNPKYTVLDDLRSGDPERYKSAVRTLIKDCRIVTQEREYPGWYDDDGVLLPKPGDDDFFTRVPTELLLCAVYAAREAISELPNSLRPTGITSGRTSGLVVRIKE